MDNPKDSTPCVLSTPAQAKEFSHPLSGVPPQEEGITSVPTTPVQVKHLPYPLLGTPSQEGGGCSTFLAQEVNMESENSHYTNCMETDNCGQQQYMNSASTRNSHCDKRLRILYYNARSLLPKLNELHALITIKPPILFALWRPGCHLISYTMHCSYLVIRY